VADQRGQVKRTRDQRAIPRCAPENLDVRRGFEPDVSQSYHNRRCHLGRFSPTTYLTTRTRSTVRARHPSPFRRVLAANIDMRLGRQQLRSAPTGQSTGRRGSPWESDCWPQTPRLRESRWRQRSLHDAGAPVALSQAASDNETQLHLDIGIRTLGKHLKDAGWTRRHPCRPDLG
jgi:hypothetical protein